MKAVISGDIVASTSLSDAGRENLEKNLKEFIEHLSNKFNTYTRIIRGDYLECVVPNPKDALQVALATKSFIKSIYMGEMHFQDINDRRVRIFKSYGIRLAIGYGELSRFSPIDGIIDGEAIYLSGRKINEFSTYNKERVVIKNTLFFVSNNLSLNKRFEPIMELLDVIVNKATSRQCQVLYLKLMGYNEEEIAPLLKITQSVVNKHSTNLGWNAIENAVNYFSNEIEIH